MKKQYSILFLAIIFFSACHKNEIDKTIVLKVGKLEVTRYEFERNKKRELTVNGSDSSALKDTKKLAEWKRNYIDKCLVIADAYEKEYDTLRVLQKQVNAVGDEMMVQKYGYLWMKTIGPMVDSYRELNADKINKRKKLFYFDYVSCDNIDTLLRVINNDTVLENKDEFLKLKIKSTHHKTLKSGYISNQWPFLYFWTYREQLYNMKIGEVSQLLKSQNNYFYLYLDHVESVELSTKDEENLQMEMQLGIAKEMEDKESNEMDALCKPVFNNTNIDTLAQFLSKGNSISRFNKNLELIQYNINNTLRKITFNEFLDYYSNLFMRKEITDRESLIENVAGFYETDYLSTKARNLNLYNTDVYKLDRKNFLNNMMYGRYLENEIVKSIKIDSSEIIRYYNNNLSSFELPKTIIVNLYTFDSKEDAFRNKAFISEMFKHNETGRISDTSAIKGLRNYTPGLAIKIDEDENCSAELINLLQETPLHTLSSIPILYKGKYGLIYKTEEQGRFIQSLESVYGKIDDKLKNERIEDQMKALVERLRSKYKIEIDKTGVK